MATTLASSSARLALLDALIDDASLYPPASLAMGRSLQAHARDRESAYAFVQGRYVVAISRLPELVAARDPVLPLRLSVVLDGGVAGLAGLSALDGAANVAVEGFEVRLGSTPADVARSAATIDALAAGHAGSGAPVDVWFEVPFDRGWTIAPRDVLAALAALRGGSEHVRVGAKLRTGGLTADALPSVDEVAAFVVAAQATGVPWKATAGLHHPVRRADRTSGRPMHGFLNVFVAGIALHVGAVDAARVAEILAEEDPRAFAVDGAHVGWREITLDPAAVAAGRSHAVSFGSCSFFEPVDDLRRLGLLA